MPTQDPLDYFLLAVSKAFLVGRGENRVVFARAFAKASYLMRR